MFGSKENNLLSNVLTTIYQEEGKDVRRIKTKGVRG